MRRKRYLADYFKCLYGLHGKIVSKKFSRSPPKLGVFGSVSLWLVRKAIDFVEYPETYRMMKRTKQTLKELDGLKARLDDIRKEIDANKEQETPQ